MELLNFFFHRVIVIIFFNNLIRDDYTKQIVNIKLFICIKNFFFNIHMNKISLYVHKYKIMVLLYVYYYLKHIYNFEYKGQKIMYKGIYFHGPPNFEF